MNVPIIRLEIQGMQTTVMTALTQYAAQMDSDIQAAVAECLTVEKLTAIIKKTADEEIIKAIHNEMREFYTRGRGNQIIRKVVNETLTQQADFMERHHG